MGDVDAARIAVRAFTNAYTSPPLSAVVAAPVPPVAAPMNATAGDPRATLQSLKDWHADGLITDEEYAAKRAEVLSRI